ncbi:tRNA (guanosine(37)-N1)-methyltransferase TrmD [Oscillospiraceae bacterium HV4-5-C5C]|nr:tRNA (guanosine(37)-N1)-methyltransferase TrmD [Oscillospiraceae bacterium HV4-5-C5C]
MFFRVLTLFPDLIESVCSQSIIGRAREKGLLDIQAINIRDYAANRYGKVDDSLYGGGTGMLMQCQPIWEAWQEALSQWRQIAAVPGCRTIYLSPKGPVLDQRKVNELAAEPGLILLCGHYEGVDDRVLQAIQAEELSIGDYILTGGEMAAAIVIDAVSRQQAGVLPNTEAYTEESLYNGSLESRQYTKPEIWQGEGVPAVLLSGHHAKISRWRQLDGWRETLLKRPDLFNRLQLAAQDYQDLSRHLLEPTD